MADLMHKLRKYKAYLKVHPDGDKVLPVLQKLSTLPMSIATLQETGIGKVVNGFRKQGGDIGDCAKSLVAQWKDLVTSEAKLRHGGEESADERGDESEKDNNGSDVEEDVSAKHSEDDSDDAEQEHEAAEHSEKEEEPYADGSDYESERGSASMEGSGSPDHIRQSESEEEEIDGSSCYVQIEEDNSDESGGDGHRTHYQSREGKDDLHQRLKAEKYHHDWSSSETAEHSSPRKHIHGEDKEKHHSSHKSSSSSTKQHQREGHKSNHKKHGDPDHRADIKHSSNTRAADKHPEGHKNSSSKSSQKQDKSNSSSSKRPPQAESEEHTSTSHQQKTSLSKSHQSSSRQSSSHSSKSRDHTSEDHHKAESHSSSYHSKSQSSSHHPSSGSKHKSLSPPSVSVNKHLPKTELHQMESSDSSGSKNKILSSKTTSSGSSRSKDEKIGKVDSGHRDREKSSKPVVSPSHKHSSGKDLLPRKSHSSTNNDHHRAGIGEKQDKERQKQKERQTSSRGGHSKPREDPRSQSPGQASKSVKSSSLAERDSGQVNSGDEEEEEVAESCDDYEEYIDRWVEDGIVEYNPSAVKPKISRSKTQSTPESERSQSVEDYEEYISKQAARASTGCAEYTPGPVNKKPDKSHSWHGKDGNRTKHGHVEHDKNHSSSKKSHPKVDSPHQTHSVEYIPTRIKKEKGNMPDAGKSTDPWYQKSKSRGREKYTEHADNDSEQEVTQYISSPIKREKERKPVFEVFSGDDDDEGHSDKEWKHREESSKPTARLEHQIQDEKLHHRDDLRKSSCSMSSKDQRNQIDEKQLEGKVRYDGKIFSEPKQKTCAPSNIKSASGAQSTWDSSEKRKRVEGQDNESRKSKEKKARGDLPVTSPSKSDRNIRDAVSRTASSNTKRENKGAPSSTSKQKRRSRPMTEAPETSLFSCLDDHSIKTTVKRESRPFTASSSKSKQGGESSTESGHKVQGKDSRVAAEGRSSKDHKLSSEKLHHQSHGNSRDKDAEQISTKSKDRSDKVVSKAKERVGEDSQEHKSSRTKERGVADKTSDSAEHSRPGDDDFSFEDFMNYDEMSLRKKKKLADKALKPKDDARRREPVQISPANKIKITSEEILSMLPETSAHYRPLRFHPLNEDRHREKEDIYVDPMLIGSKTSSRTKVYSGQRHGLTEVKSLFDLCIQVLIDNIDAIDYVGGIPFEVLRAVLERATPVQLFNLENYNHHFLEDTDNLWQAHCERDFRGCEPDEMETWRELYLRKCDEREAKYQKLKTAMSTTITRGQAGRKVRLAFTDTIAKPPRDVLRRQLKYGTAGISRAGRPIPSSNKTSFDGPSISSSSSAALQHLKDYRHLAGSPIALGTRVDPFQPNKPKIVAPMMQKTLTMMKKIRR